MQKVRIFIGSEPKTELARKVLEYSIKVNTKQPDLIEFPSLMGEDWIKNPKLGVGTGFSLKRWEIPAMCNFEGYAIYLDADQLVFGDILDLWQSDIHYPNNACSVWCTYQPCKWFQHKTPETSVMFIDCAKAKFNQKSITEIKEYLKGDKDRKRYVEVMRGMDHKNAPQMIPDSWNHLNVYKEGKTKLLHYTKEPEQPWVYPDHSLTYLWEDVFIECLSHNIITQEELKYWLNQYRSYKKKERGSALHPYYKKYVI